MTYYQTTRFDNMIWNQKSKTKSSLICSFLHHQLR